MCFTERKSLHQGPPFLEASMGPSPSAAENLKLHSIFFDDLVVMPLDWVTFGMYGKGWGFLFLSSEALPQVAEAANTGL